MDVRVDQARHQDLAAQVYARGIGQGNAADILDEAILNQDIGTVEQRVLVGIEKTAAGEELFTGGRFLDPHQDALLDGADVLIENGFIKDVGRITLSDATRIDLRGKILMPGLIDAHIHLFLSEVNLQLLADVPLTLLAAKGA